MVTMRFDCKALAQFLAGGCAVACILIANGQAPGNAPGMDIGSALRPVPGEVIQNLTTKPIAASIPIQS